MSPLPVEQAQPQTLDQEPLVGSRAALISQSLKTVARRARTPRNIWVAVGAGPQRRWQHIFAWAILASFGLVVLLPNLVAGIYLGFFASNQYASEFRFAVRASQSSSPDSLGGLSSLRTMQQVQDSLILTDYIESRSLVEALDRTLNLRQMFSRDRIDLFSRFNSNDTNEELMYYWRNHVSVHIDSMSGVITVVLRAFTPQDSLAISNQVITLSEGLVNDLSERVRRDALRQAEVELARTNENRREKSLAMRDARNSEGMLDSSKATDVITQMVGDLRLDLIRLQQEYSAQRRTILPSSPQLRVMEARIDSMKEQIRRLEAQMTAGDKTTSALSDIINRFERQALDKDIAEKQYVAAATAFERARLDLESQQVYLATFLKPVLAQEALYPRRIWLWSIVTVITLLAWGAGVGIASLIRNHVAV